MREIKVGIGFLMFDLYSKKLCNFNFFLNFKFNFFV